MRLYGDTGLNGAKELYGSTGLYGGHRTLWGHGAECGQGAVWGCIGLYGTVQGRMGLYGPTYVWHQVTVRAEPTPIYLLQSALTECNEDESEIN